MKRLIQSISFAALIATAVPLAASAVPNVIAQGRSPRLEQNRRTPVRKSIGGSAKIVQPCPEGQKIIMWDKPIYDEQGLFIIGHEKVPMCVPIDGKPAG